MTNHQYLHNHILDDYLVLKILKEHSNITVYEIHDITSKIPMEVPEASLYPLVRKLMQNKFIVITGRRLVKHGILRKCKRNRSCYELALTSDGHKQLIKLGCILSVILDLKLYGEQL
jgi:DNA-binding PadR family transcriptional regulator